MENEIKDNKYFILWLYISILLHLLMVIIMLSTKSAHSPCKDPDPASMHSNEAQVIFMQDQPDPIIPTQPDFKLATRIQGGQIGMQTEPAATKEAHIDIPEPALSEHYKKSIHNQTHHQDQDHNGQVDIPQDAQLDMKIQSITTPTAPDLIQTPTLPAQDIDHQDKAEYQENTRDQNIKINPADALKAIIQEKMSQQQALKQALTDESLPVHKQPESAQAYNTAKKHRIAEIGQENLSKVQLTKHIQDTGTGKNKISLMDIQKGFSQFVQNNQVTIPTPSTSSTLGNSLLFSSTGNSDKDDISGLRFASYMNQAGKMYNSAFSEYSDHILDILHKEGVPKENNQIMIAIDRSGKVISCTTLSHCGNPVLDNYHLKIIEAIGSFPPIPQYIPTPLQVHAHIPFKSINSQTLRRAYRP